MSRLRRSPFHPNSPKFIKLRLDNPTALAREAFHPPRIDDFYLAAA
jgi:hypothetical protein